MDKKKSDSSTNDFLNLLKEAGFRSIDQLIGNAEKEIAEKEFVDRTTLYKLQRGNKNPQIKTLKFLAEALSLGPNKKRFSVDDIIKDRFPYCKANRARNINEGTIQIASF